MGEHGVIAETQACHDDPFLHGCAFSAQWSADEEGVSAEKEGEAMQGQIATAHTGTAYMYTWVLPLLCDGLVGAILLGILLWLLGRCHNGVRATLRRPWRDVAEELAGILSWLSAGDMLGLGCLGLIVYELRPGTFYFGLAVTTTLRADQRVGEWIVGQRSGQRPSITPHGD